jgi:predicted DNA-binding transcriptional regulator YafY
MVHTGTIEMLKRMDQMIRTKSTGTPEDFAGRLYLSERSLYNYIGLMKALGAPIRYSRTERSYVYEEVGRLVIGFKQPAELNHAT